MNENVITIDTGESLKKVSYEPYKDLVPETDPILHRKSAKFLFDGKNDPVEISERLKETLKANKAYGVAAPQCGLDMSVISIGVGDFYLTMFNPEIVYIDEETNHMVEGCLSFPFLLLNVTRPKSIRVKFDTEEGNTREMMLDGISARIVQHEVDHLNGITFDKLAKPLALKNGMKKRNKYMKRFVKDMILNKKFV